MCGVCVGVCARAFEWGFYALSASKAIFRARKTCEKNVREKRALRNETTCSEKIATCYKHEKQFTVN